MLEVIFILHLLLMWLWTKRRLSWIIIACACVGSASFAGLLANDQPLGTRLWNTKLIKTDTTAIGKFLVTQWATELYLQANTDISDKVYENFISKLRKQDIQVYFLLGDAKWIYPEQQTKLSSTLDRYTRYQKQATTKQKFVWLHMDVEPYTLDGRDRDQSGTILLYQQLIRSIIDRLPEEEIIWDVPFWFDVLPYQNVFWNWTLGERLWTTTDGLTIMAYRNTAKKIQSIITEEVALAKRYDKKLIIWVETGKSSEWSSVSFCGKGMKVVKKELNKVADTLDNEWIYFGFAIHHYTTRKAMK